MDLATAMYQAQIERVKKEYRQSEHSEKIIADAEEMIARAKIGDPAE